MSSSEDRARRSRRRRIRADSSLESLLSCRDRGLTNVESGSAAGGCPDRPNHTTPMTNRATAGMRIRTLPGSMVVEFTMGQPSQECHTLMMVRKNGKGLAKPALRFHVDVDGVVVVLAGVRNRDAGFVFAGPLVHMRRCPLVGRRAAIAEVPVV